MPRSTNSEPARLTLATTHEVAHQWFYSLVGNDQARDPWLDEGHPTDYFLGVYAQGPQALASLGAPASVDCALRKYVATEAYGIAQPADLVSALEAELPGATAKLAAFGVRTAAG